VRIVQCKLLFIYGSCRLQPCNAPKSVGKTHQLTRRMISSGDRPMYRLTDIYWPIWRCCRCILSAIFAHKSVTLLLCMERSETQVATSSPTLMDQHKRPVLFLVRRAFMPGLPGSHKQKRRDQPLKRPNRTEKSQIRDKYTTTPSKHPKRFWKAMCTYFLHKKNKTHSIN